LSPCGKACVNPAAWFAGEWRGVSNGIVDCRLKCLSSRAAFFSFNNQAFSNQQSKIKNALPKFWARKIALLGRTYGQGYCTYAVVVIFNKLTITYVHYRTLLAQIPILGRKIYPLAPGEAKKPVRSICGMPIAASATARRATRTTGLAPTTLEPVKVRQRALKTRSTTNQQLTPTFNDLHQLSTT
jgi:hypothetical protein